MKLAMCAVVLVGSMLLAGCGGGSGEQLGPIGTVSMQGQDPLTLRAPADGQLSVYDVSDESLVYSGLIHKGQTLVVDPAARKILVDGQVANTKPLYGGNTLKIQFDENK